MIAIPLIQTLLTCFFYTLILVTILVWKFPRSHSVICFDRWVSKEGHKHYIQDWIKLSWHSRSWMTQSILAISVRGYLTLIWKDSIIHMHGLAVYVKQGLPFAQDLSLENSEDSYVFDWLYLSRCLTYLSSINDLLCCYAPWLLMLFHLTYSSTFLVLSIIPSANVFVFGDFNVNHKDWLTYSGWTDRAGELKWPYSEPWLFCGD